MADRRSALAGLARPVPAAAPQATLREIAPGSIVQVAAWPETAERVRAAIAALIGIAPPALGRAAGDDRAWAAQISPGRYLLLTERGDAAAGLEAALAGDAAVTDLGEARTLLRLEGPMAAAVLAKGVALDLDPAAFPVGRAAPTAIHHVDLLLHRRGADRFDILVFRSLAESLGEWLLDAGLEFSLSFG